MTDWPDKLELSADKFDRLDSWELFEYIGPWMLSVFDVQPSESPRSFQIAGSAYWLWADAGNGGLKQYFYNSAPGLPLAVESLQLLKRNRAANILVQAISLLPSPSMMEDCEARRAFVAGEGGEQLRTLDDSFWGALDDESFCDALAAYVRSQRADFQPYFASAD